MRGSAISSVCGLLDVALAVLNKDMEAKQIDDGDTWTSNECASAVEGVAGQSY